LDRAEFRPICRVRPRPDPSVVLNFVTGTGSWSVTGRTVELLGLDLVSEVGRAV